VKILFDDAASFTAADSRSARADAGRSDAGRGRYATFLVDRPGSWHRRLSDSASSPAEGISNVQLFTVGAFLNSPRTESRFGGSQHQRHMADAQPLPGRRSR